MTVVRSMISLARCWRVLFIALLLMPACSCEDLVESTDPQGWQPRTYGTYTPPNRPVLEAPSVVDFGVVALGERVERVVELRNIGRSVLTFDSWSLSTGFEMSFDGFMTGQQPKTLEAGATITLRLSYLAQRDQASGQLVIKSDDAISGSHTIDLMAGLEVPCVEVTPVERVNFGSVRIGEQERQEVLISNCSATQVLELSLKVSLTTDVTGFAVEDPRRFIGLVLEPASAPVRVPVVFSPRQEGPYRDELLFATNVPGKEELTVELRGQGAPLSCPTPVIVASHPERGQVKAAPRGTYEGLPLDRVSLSALDSEGAEGSRVTRVSWSIVRRPQDSAASLEREFSSFENELWLDLSGDYEVELEVWDSRGTRSCRPARLVLRAVPDKDFHIQLVWDTPHDGAQLDTEGSDVDLHLLHEQGRWNQVPYDCFWQNESPDWGVRDEGRDDPSLDIDDTDGWGPENINLNNPEDGVTYGVGVHYFSDHGFGSSLVTVRFYLGGVLAREYRRQRLRDQEFWRVFQVSWPDRVITDTNLVTNTIPNNLGM